jgi:hypothetical protein
LFFHLYALMENPFFLRGCLVVFLPPRISLIPPRWRLGSFWCEWMVQDGLTVVLWLVACWLWEHSPGIPGNPGLVLHLAWRRDFRKHCVGRGMKWAENEVKEWVCEMPGWARPRCLGAAFQRPPPLNSWWEKPLTCQASFSLGHGASPLLPGADRLYWASEHICLCSIPLCAQDSLRDPE